MAYETIFRLDNKIVLCVGVGGIGEEIAVGFADFGANVICADIDEEKAQAVLQRLSSIRKESETPVGESARSLIVDITDPASIDRCMKQIKVLYGRLDILVNTVGANIFKNAKDMTLNEFERTVALNLTGAWSVSKAAASLMETIGRGKIINFASVTAFYGSSGQGAYAAAKAGIVSLTKTLALEWISKGIYVNAISPVLTETPINRDWLNSEPNRRSQFASRIPIARLGTTGDFVGPTVFLASAASDFVIGQTICVDGGTSVRHPMLT